jgi:Cdc6-like AAA superfamily ATPase
MTKDVWLPVGYEFNDGLKIHSLLFSGEDWQIFQSYDPRKILIARPELAQKWIDEGFINESLMRALRFGANHYRSLSCHQMYMLEPVGNTMAPNNKVDAIAFATAFRESLKISNDTSFHDAIYIEQYSRLLPTWTSTSPVYDEVVLGAWLTGGIAISTDSFRRLSSLVGWASPADIAEIVAAAGFQTPTDVSIFARGNTDDWPEKKGDIFYSVSRSTRSSSAGDEKTNHKSFSLPGRPDLETFFNEHVLDIIFNVDKYEALGINFPSAIVLYGPPGCGKTFAVERLIEFIDWPSFSISSSTVGSPYIHDTSKKISDVFDKALDAAPSIIVIDEMESFLSDRQMGGASGLHHIEEVAEFLQRIPEAINNKVLVIAMTNLIEIIDPAILRRGRFDYIIEVGMPSQAEVESLLRSLLEETPKTDDIDISPLVETLTGKPLSDIAFVVREAARLAAKDRKPQIDQDCISNALVSLPKLSQKKDRYFTGF